MKKFKIIILAIICLLCIIQLILGIWYIYKDIIYFNNQDQNLPYKRAVLDRIFDDDLFQKNLNNIPIYIINLPKSTHRRERMNKQIKTFKIQNVTFIKAINGKQIKSVDNNIFKVNNLYFYISHPNSITNGEKGCVLSHIKAIETAYLNGDKYAIIMEDDLDLSLIKTWEFTINKLIEQAPSDWEAIFSLFLEKNIYFKNNDFISYKEKLGAFFYIINRKGMKKIIDKYIRNSPIYNKLFILDKNIVNHLVADAYIPFLIKSYIYKNPFVLPWNDKGNFNSTIHKGHTNGHIIQAKKLFHYIYDTLPVQNPQIPKKLHLIWIGNKKPPISLSSWKIKFKNKYPNWQVIIWNDKMINNLQLVNKIIYDDMTKMCGKADIARYEIIYRYGGLYIDADTVFLGNKLPIFKGQINLFKETDNLFSNNFIASIKSHPFWKYMIENLPQWYEKNKHLDPWKSTGPKYLTHIINKLKLAMHDLYILDRTKIICPENWHNIKDRKKLEKNCMKKDAFMFHYGLSTNN